MKWMNYTEVMLCRGLESCLPPKHTLIHEKRLGHRLSRVSQQHERQRHAGQSGVEDEQERRRRRGELLHARRQYEHDPELCDRPAQNSARFAMARTMVGDASTYQAVTAVMARAAHIHPYTAPRNALAWSATPDRKLTYL